MASPSVHIYLLGRFEVVRDQRILKADAWSRRKAALLLQLLALERRMIKDQVIETLWPESGVNSGANNLYQTLHILRQTLDTALGSGSAEAVISFESGTLSLNADVWVDAEAFEWLCTDTSPEVLQQALTLYQGDLLPETLYDDWTQARRATLQHLHREAVLKLAAYRRDGGDYDTALSLVVPLLTHDPTDETAHRELMRLYALSGQRHEALRQYQRCVKALEDELGLTPDPATEALYAQILNGALTAPKAAISGHVPTPSTIEVERDTLLVGRNTELATIRRLIFDQSDISGRTILLAGDAGVGKTQLAYEVLRDAAESGMTTLFGAAYEQEGQLSYQPFIEAFDRYLAEHPSAGQNPITHYVPFGGYDEQEHTALFRATATFLGELAQRAPLMLLVDDLHAADETSLHLFHYLARQTRSTQVILLATYRSDGISSSALDALLNALYREHLSETVILSPLAHDDVGKIVSHIVGGEAAPALLQAIAELTEGNPFFTQEIARALLKFDQIEEQAGQWQLRPNANLHLPAGLRGLIRERVARLGEWVEPLLRTAAVIGQQFRYELLRDLSELSDDRLLDALDAALDGQLLEEVGTGYRFRHPLIRQALYEGLSRARRAHLHTRVAEVIEAGRPPDELSAQAETLAYHYDASDRRARALPYLIQAAEKAQSVYAFEVAVDDYDRALKLLDTLDDDPAQRWHILEQVGALENTLADSQRSVAHFEQALALAPTASWQPRSTDRARLHRWAAITLVTAGDMGAAERHLRTALDLIGPDDQLSTEYACLMYTLALWHWHRNEFQAAFDVAQRSLSAAEQIGDQTNTARAFEMLALAAHSLGEWQQGLDFEAQRSALAGPGLDVTGLFDMHLCLWEYHLYGDKPYAEVRQTVETTLQQARRMGAPRAIALCQCFGGALEYQAGHWHQAEAALRESIDLYRQIGAAVGEALACQRLGRLQTALGQLGEGMSTLETGVVAAERADLRAHCLTRLYATMTRNRLTAGDVTAAERTLALGLETSDQHGHCSTCDLLLLPAAVSVRIAQGDLDAAGVFLRQLEQAAARYGSGLWVAMARQARGEYRTACGDLDDALTSYADAQAGFQAAGYDYEVARCLLQSADIRLSRRAPGDAEPAAADRSEAEQILQRLKTN